MEEKASQAREKMSLARNELGMPPPTLPHPAKATGPPCTHWGWGVGAGSLSQLLWG